MRYVVVRDGIEDVHPTALVHVRSSPACEAERRVPLLPSRTAESSVFVVHRDAVEVRIVNGNSTILCLCVCAGSLHVLPLSGFVG